MRLDLRKLIVRQPKMIPIHQRFLSEAVNHMPDIMPTTLWVRTLSLLLGHHLKTGEIRDAKGCRDRDVCRVTPAPHNNAADAGVIVACVHRVPAPCQKDLEPGAE